MAPLYVAGFTTAFGAHSVAAGFGAESHEIGLTLLNLGILLAVYDLAEVVLKPVFGSLADRVGAKPVILGGLLVFAAVSAIGIFTTGTLALGIVRFGQGAAASAFSPASSATVARLAGSATLGRFFGRFGSWKGLGYALGPILGAALIWAGGFPVLFAVLAILAAAAAIWTAIALPAVEPLPRRRYTVIDLVRQTTQRSFLLPTLALAAATGSLGAAVGFLPAIGTSLGMNIFASTAVITILAVTSSLIQPFIGRSRDRARVTDRAGMTTGLLILALAIAAVGIFPSALMLYLGAIAIGVGIGVITPLGFAYLADTTPSERMGRTMGTAELGRELGDAGGPLLVGGVAASIGAAAGLGALAVVVFVAGLLTRTLLPDSRDLESA